MIIVHIIESSATGTLSIVNMAANHQTKVNDVTVIFSRRPDTPENIKKTFANDVKLIEDKLQAKYFPFSVFSLRKHIKNLNPDVVHCHSSFAGFVGRLAAIGFKSKVFYSPHCISFMRKDISFFKRTLFKLFEKIGCLKNSTYIACSQSEQYVIKAELPGSRVVLLENAVDLRDFRKELNVSPKIQRIITVGGIRPQKGPEEFAKIAQSFDGSDIEFVWIGDGDLEHKQALLDAGVVVTGWLPRQQVIEELYQSDLYLSTARWEGMPVSIIEACAAGLPVVARNCDGNKDIINNKKNGLLFDTTECAIKYISDCINDVNFANQLANAANSQVFERFSIVRFHQQLSEIYKSSNRDH